ncbi:MAG: dimethylsulfonioproprionate lyase family protein [Rhodobacterales bacterium]|uniref:dimethylsulfonioproprionate lyase family protein n=1 Tax=Pseudophaeobacter sp. TrK17 TaxID=2815167 RepID=UPI0035CFC7E8|tara:strand:- start:1788 stop:2375 length:588 start_codon:yes stop_codon:yes gene_type:complete
MRNRALQEFLDAARIAYSARARDPNSVSLVEQVFATLESPAPQSQSDSGRLPVCKYLTDIANPSVSDEPDLRQVMTTFFSIEPTLRWRRRQGDCSGASEGFAENHANAMIVGPGGLEPREGVWLGVSLLGPNVQYPNHRHPPQETYLVMNTGDFRQGRNEWVHVAKGETFYNPHNIPHAMRSNDLPLLVFWVLKE